MEKKFEQSIRSRISQAIGLRSSRQFAEVFKVSERKINYAIHKMFGSLQFKNLSNAQKEMLGTKFVYKEMGYDLTDDAIRNLNKMKILGSNLIELQLRATEDLLQEKEKPLDVLKAIPKESLISAIATALVKEYGDSSKLDSLAKQMPMLQEKEEDE